MEGLARGVGIIRFDVQAQNVTNAWRQKTVHKKKTNTKKKGKGHT